MPQLILLITTGLTFGLLAASFALFLIYTAMVGGGEQVMAVFPYVGTLWVSAFIVAWAGFILGLVLILRKQRNVALTLCTLFNGITAITPVTYLMVRPWLQ